MSETRKLAAILVADVVGYKPARRRRRGAHACAPSGPPQRFGRSLHRRPSRPAERLMPGARRSTARIAAVACQIASRRPERRLRMAYGPRCDASLVLKTVNSLVALRIATVLQ